MWTWGKAYPKKTVRTPVPAADYYGHAAFRGEKGRLPAAFCSLKAAWCWLLEE